MAGTDNGNGTPFDGVLSESDIAELQAAVDQVVLMLYEETIDKGDNFLFDIGNPGYDEINFGAYYDAPEGGVGYYGFVSHPLGDAGWLAWTGGYPISNDPFLNIKITPISILVKALFYF